MRNAMINTTHGLKAKSNSSKLKTFQKKIWDYYKEHGRPFAWRETVDPYKIVVSEVMLQQTQTYRVAPKYEFFIQKFPTFQALASASLQEVLAAWQGLGYNRRGLYLHKLAKIIVADYNGVLPDDPAILVMLPGIGKATASSICAFAFNQPTVFIETNIRAVYIHFFFQHTGQVHDKDIFPLIEQSVDKKEPRLWYYALMDYGVMLKKKHKNPSRKSKHHIVQSKFEGSDRQIRGRIIKFLTSYGAMEYHLLLDAVDREEVRVERILDDLVAEELIKKSGNSYHIA